MKKLSFALAAASLVSFGIAPASQAGEGGIAAGAAVTLNGGVVESLAVSAAVGKNGAAVATRSAATNVVVDVPNFANPIFDAITDGFGNTSTFIVGYETVPTQVGTDVVNEAYAIGTSGTITANSLTAADALADGTGTSEANTALNPVFQDTDDQSYSVPQANEIGDSDTFAIFNPATGTITIFEGGNVVGE